MSCGRCRAAVVTRTKWCDDCERAFDTWNRRNATDIVVSVLGGMLVMLAVGVGLPLLGLSWIVATTGAFGGFGMVYGSQRLLGRKRRRQFLVGAIPRAYLPGAK